MVQVKVLCLHGMGVNAEVFAAQTSNYRSLLPSYYEFDFADAELFCDPSPGAADYYAGPYRCWYTSPSSENVASAHKALSHIIATRGPYQMIMGFSQGAALAASYLLHAQLEGRAAPVKAAIFICSPLPFARTLDQGLDCRENFNVPYAEPLPVVRPTRVPQHLIPDAYFLRNCSSDEGSSKNSVHLPRTDSGVSLARADLPRTDSGISLAGASSEKALPKASGPYYNMFHPSCDSVRLDLPTAHIYGASDSWKGHGLDLLKLCANARAFQHDGGHEIPQYASEEICDLIEDLTIRAGIL